MMRQVHVLHSHCLPERAGLFPLAGPALLQMRTHPPKQMAICRHLCTPLNAGAGEKSPCSKRLAATITFGGGAFAARLKQITAATVSRTEEAMTWMTSFRTKLSKATVIRVNRT